MRPGQTVNATWVQDFCGSYWGRGALSAGVAELVGGNPGAASNHVSSQGTLDWLETEEEMESWRHSWRSWSGRPKADPVLTTFEKVIRY